MRIVKNSRTTLRAIGKDERWLQDWIVEEPSRLGLGPIVIKSVELNQHRNRGGRLDILAYRGDIDTFYEIEIMLGECDADHGFRVLDYWARERQKNPNARHCAVLVAEDLSGRYDTVIETLPQFLPLIAVEIRVLLIDSEAGICTIDTSIVAQPDSMSLSVGDEPSEEKKVANPQERSSWEAKESQGFISTVDLLTKYCIDEIGPSRLDWSAQSYVSLKKGRRCWLPMWPRKDGVYVYVAGGSGGAADSPSDFYRRVREKLMNAGMEEPSWTFKYNAGANPIGFKIPLDKAEHSFIREILNEAYEMA